MSKRRRVRSQEQWGCRNLAGLLFFFLAFLLLFPTGRALFQWTHREGYVRREIEMTSSRHPSRVSRGRAQARVLATGELIALDPLHFPELMTGRTVQHANFESGRRLEVWHNPQAVVFLGPLRIADQRVLSLRSYPERPRLNPALLLLAAAVVISVIGFALYRWPQSARPALSSTRGER